MPVRLLNSSVLKWPDRTSVDLAIRGWVGRQFASHHELKRAAYFGSDARNDWGVGSDLDLLLIVDHTDQPYHQRSANWDTLDLPVAVDLFVYTTEEWQTLRNQRPFFRQIQREAVWITPDTSEGN